MSVPNKQEDKEIPIGIKWEWDETKQCLTYKTNVTLSDKTDKNKKKTRDGKIDLRSGVPRIVRQNRHKDEITAKLDLRKQMNSVVAIHDITNAAINMLSERYYIPVEFENYCNNKKSKVVLEDFLLHLANYFYWYFEAIDSKLLSNPMCIERNEKEKHRIETAEIMIKKNLKALAKIYCMLILGLGSTEYHHMMGGKKRVSCGFKDRGIFETLYPFCTFFIWITFKRRDYEKIHQEIGRMLRSDAFNNSLKFEHLVDDENMNSDSEKVNSKEFILNKFETNRQHIMEFNSQLHQRSPALVSLLPLPQENSKWLFNRRHENQQNESSFPKNDEVDDSDLEMIREVGIIGQPLKLFHPKTLALKGNDDEQNPENKNEEGNPDENHQESEKGELTTRNDQHQE